MQVDLRQLGGDSLAVLRRFSPVALLAAIGSAVVFALLLDLWLPLSIVLAVGVYVGVALLLGKPFEMLVIDEVQLSPDEEAYVRAREDTAHVLQLGQQIEDTSMRGRVESIGQTFDRMLDIMQEDNNYTLAPDYEAVLVEPFAKKLAYYVRLTIRDIDLANPQLVRFREVDVPRNEAVARTFYQRYHDGDVMDLAALLETFWDDDEEIEEEPEIEDEDQDDPEVRL